MITFQVLVIDTTPRGKGASRPPYLTDGLDTTGVTIDVVRADKDLALGLELANAILIPQIDLERLQSLIPPPYCEKTVVLLDKPLAKTSSELWLAGYLTAVRTDSTDVREAIFCAALNRAQHLERRRLPEAARLALRASLGLASVGAGCADQRR